MAIDHKQIQKLLEPGVREWVKTSGFAEWFCDVAKALNAGKITEDEWKGLMLGAAKGMSEAVNPGLRSPTSVKR